MPQSNYPPGGSREHREQSFHTADYPPSSSKEHRGQSLHTADAGLPPLDFIGSSRPSPSEAARHSPARGGDASQSFYPSLSYVSRFSLTDFPARHRSGSFPYRTLPGQERPSTHSLGFRYASSVPPPPPSHTRDPADTASHAGPSWPPSQDRATYRRPYSHSFSQGTRIDTSADHTRRDVNTHTLPLKRRHISGSSTSPVASKVPPSQAPSSSSSTATTELEKGRDETEQEPSTPRRAAKPHVPSACLNCKRAHLACDLNRPCRRCINVGKTETCVDVRHKKRGRPRLRSKSTVVPEEPLDLREPRGLPAAYGASPSIGSHHASSSYVPAVRRMSDSSMENNTMPLVSLILSTEMECFRCSKEAQRLLGYYPEDLLARSLFDLVHPDDAHQMEELWLGLIEPVGVRPGRVPATIDALKSLSPVLLMIPATGTIFLQEVMRFRLRSGDYDLFSVRLHLGGGFGADLYRNNTLDRAYIVASLLKVGHHGAHPHPRALRIAQWQDQDANNEFHSPPSSTWRSSTSGGPNEPLRSKPSEGDVHHTSSHTSTLHADVDSPSVESAAVESAASPANLYENREKEVVAS